MRKITAAVAALCLMGAPAAWSQAPADAEMQRGVQVLQKQMALMSPELRERAQALPPEIRRFLVKIALKHDRHSDRLTLVQVMQEILADYQAVSAALAIGNAEGAAEAARRIANHRLPRGGMLPYLPLEKVNAADLSVLPAMEVAIEGSATSLAAAADKGDLVAAAQHFGTIASGCVACHQHFRGLPGASPRVRP